LPLRSLLAEEWAEKKYDALALCIDVTQPFWKARVLSSGGLQCCQEVFIGHVRFDEAILSEPAHERIPRMAAPFDEATKFWNRRCHRAAAHEWLFDYGFADARCHRAQREMADRRSPEQRVPSLAAHAVDCVAKVFERERIHEIAVR